MVSCVVLSVYLIPKGAWKYVNGKQCIVLSPVMNTICLGLCFSFLAKENLKIYFKERNWKCVLKICSAQPQSLVVVTK